MSDELERREIVEGEVLPPAGVGDSGLSLTIAEAWALWDFLEEAEPPYWDRRLSSLHSKLKVFTRTGSWD